MWVNPIQDDAFLSDYGDGDMPALDGFVGVRWLAVNAFFVDEILEALPLHFKELESLTVIAHDLRGFHG